MTLVLCSRGHPASAKANAVFSFSAVTVVTSTESTWTFSQKNNRGRWKEVTNVLPTVATDDWHAAPANPCLYCVSMPSGGI